MGFATGFNAGFSAVTAMKDRERQKMLDDRDAALHAERMAEIAQAKADRQGMRDAGAERTTMTGTVTEAGGNKYLNADPVQAAKMQEMLAAEAEMTGAPTPTQQAGTGITGNMAKGHQITTDPVDLKAINSPEARAGRFQAELERQGKPLDAMQMSNAVMENKAKKLGLEVAELKFADEQFNRQLGQTFAETPDWTQAAAQVLTKTQVGGLAGVTVQAVPSQDGKKVDFVGQAQDGKQKVLATFDNTDAGKAQFLQRVMRAPVETKLGWIMEDAKEKQTQANADRDYGIKLADLEIRANEAKSKQEERALRAEIAQLRASRAGGGGGGYGGSGGAGSGVNFDPYEGFDPKNAQAEATRTVDERLSATNTQVSATERARLISEQVFALRDSYASQNANRVLTSAFVNSARNAKTPQEIEAVRQQGAARGLSPKQMAELDPRFAVAVEPQKPAAGTLKLRTPETPAPMSEFEARRKAAQEEEQKRKAAAAEAERQQRENARREALKARPDLQQLGGMRYFN
jgi:hypothetical protein